MRISSCSFNSKFNSKSNLVRNEELLPGNNACLIRYIYWIAPFLSRIIKHSRSSKIPAVICRSLIWSICSLVIFFDHQRALVYNRSDNSFWSSFLSWCHFQRTFYNFLNIFFKNSGKKMLTTDILATVTKAGKASNPEGAPNDFFEMVPVLIPSTTPSMKSCRCIKISYQVKVSFIWEVLFNQFSVFILWNLKAKAKP